MKIAILGYAGSGKTHVADLLSKSMSLDCLHLDTIKYDKEWKPIDNTIVLPQVETFMQKEDWIIEGFYDYLYFEERLSQANQIILILLPRFTCLFRAIKRTKSRRQEGYKNDMNLWFATFVLFGCRSKERRKKYQEIMQKYKDKTIILKSQKEIDHFLKETTELII